MLEIHPFTAKSKYAKVLMRQDKHMQWQEDRQIIYIINVYSSFPCPAQIKVIEIVSDFK